METFFMSLRLFSATSAYFCDLKSEWPQLFKKWCSSTVHIASYLLYYCQHHSQQVQLLNLVITLVGYFTANNPDNQSIVQSGSQPSVLQQLANLPFQYFSQPELKAVLFPTLLSCCFNNDVNMAILSQEMSWKLIEDFVQSEDGKENILVKLVTASSVKQWI